MGQGGRGVVCAGTVVRMDTSWWLALAAVVLLALVATLVDGWGRRGRRPGVRERAPERPERSWQPVVRPGPQPTEIWWAEVPYEDGPGSPVGPVGPGSKDRPCLVLSVRGERATVAKITTQAPWW